MKRRRARLRLSRMGGDQISNHVAAIEMDAAPKNPVDSASPARRHAGLLGKMRDIGKCWSA